MTDRTDENTLNECEVCGNNSCIVCSDHSDECFRKSKFSPAKCTTCVSSRQYIELPAVQKEYESYFLQCYKRRQRNTKLKAREDLLNFWVCFMHAF